MCKGDGRKPVKTYKPMTIKKFTKLFVPPVVLKAWNRIKGEKEYREPLQPSPLPQIERHSDKMVLIGNGPSLLKSVELYKDEILKNDRIAVNFFASSDLYEQLRPNIYVFADPAFFDVPENQKKSMEALYHNIIFKTTWPIHIFMPSYAKGLELVTKLCSNQYVSVDFYSVVNQNIGPMSKFEAWEHNYICPPMRNVMQLCIYLSIYWGYPETYLLGADSSFLEQIRIDQETNELYMLDTHFYEGKSVYLDASLYKTKNGIIKGRLNDVKLHEKLSRMSLTFKYYDDLRQYAEYKQVKIYNASEFSWIDVFERRKLDNIK